MKATEKILDQLRKIKALSDRGIAGEATAAKLLLEARLEKYGLTMEDLGEDLPVKTRVYGIRSVFHRKLFYQLAYSMGLSKGTCVGKSKYWVDANDIDYADFDVAFDHYKKLMDKEFDLFYRAFVHAQKLFPESSGEDKDRPPKTREERWEERRILLMMEGIEKKSFRKQIS